MPGILQSVDSKVKTDHQLAWSTFDIVNSNDLLKENIKHIVNKDINEKNMLRILLNKDWPHSPFIRVARKLGLTKAIKETDNDFVLIRKAKILAETTLAQILILEKDITSLQIN